MGVHNNHRYFGSVGADVEVVTEDIDYFSLQAELADVSAKLTGFGDDTSPYIKVTDLNRHVICRCIGSAGT